MLRMYMRASMVMLCTGCVGKPDIGANLSSIGDEIKKLGYSEIRPPSTLHPPGTIVYVRDAIPLTLQVVCEASDVLGGAVDEILASPSVQSEWQKNAGARFSVDSSDLQRINARLGDEYVRRIIFTLGNTKVGELTDTILTRSLNVDRLTQDCAESVRDRIEAGFPLTLIQSTLGADAVYDVEFTNVLEARIKATVLSELEPVLLAEIEDSAGGKLRGSNLIWGIREDRFLFRKLIKHVDLEEQYDAMHASGDKTAERLIPPEIPVALLGAETEPTVTEMAYASMSPDSGVIYFDHGKSDLDPEAQAALDDFASDIKDRELGRIIIEGYADTVGPPDYNLELAERRANTVAERLVKAGIPARLITTEAFGETDLAVPTPAGVPLEANRSVRIYLAR